MGGESRRCSEPNELWLCNWAIITGIRVSFRNRSSVAIRLSARVCGRPRLADGFPWKPIDVQFSLAASNDRRRDLLFAGAAAIEGETREKREIAKVHASPYLSRVLMRMEAGFSVFSRSPSLLRPRPARTTSPPPSPSPARDRLVSLSRRSARSSVPLARALVCFGLPGVECVERASYYVK